MISVIVPIYNTDKYLSKCLDSILNQTYKDIELILVDDGSTDNSSLICKKYQEKDKRITYYKIKNSGQGTARNYALDRCHGEWISFIDSDDWVEKDMLEIMLTEAKKTNSDIAICGWYKNYGFMQKEQPSPPKVTLYNSNIELLQEYFSTAVSKPISTIAPMVWNKIYKSDLWKHIRFPEIKSKEDTAIMYKILSNSKKAVHIGQSKYIQFVRPKSTERKKFSSDKLYLIDIAKEKKAFIEKKYPKYKNWVTLEISKEIVKLMNEIISTFSLKKYKNTFNELYNELYNNMLLEYDNKIKSSKEYQELLNIVQKPNRFKIKAYMRGIKKTTINLLSSLYTKLNYRASNR